MLLADSVQSDCFKSSWSSGRQHMRDFVLADRPYAFFALAVWIFDLSLKGNRTGKEVWHMTCMVDVDVSRRAWCGPSPMRRRPSFWRT